MVIPTEGAIGSRQQAANKENNKYFITGYILFIKVSPDISFFIIRNPYKARNIHR
jgi:hypothetical protein